MDIPADLRLELFNSGKNKGLVLGSKAVGETPQSKAKQFPHNFDLVQVRQAYWEVCPS